MERWGEGSYSLSLLPELQLVRLVYSGWYSPLCLEWAFIGTAIIATPGFTPTHSTLALKPGMLILVLVLVLVLKDSLRTFLKSLSLSWSLGVRSLSLSLSLGGQVQEVLVLVLVL